MMLQRQLKYGLLLVIFLCLSTVTKGQTTEQETKVILRAISHEFLLQVGDSTSRVLPIEKIGERYAVAFENDFSFEPDLLFFATHKVFEAHQVKEHYIVEVQECNSETVIHSFKASLTPLENLMPCKERELPAACHVFYFTIIQSGVPSQAQTSDWSWLISGIIILLLLTGGLIYFKGKQKATKQNNTLIPIGLFQFDQKAMLLRLKAQSIELSSKEADLLSLLVTHENETLKREEILKEVWGDDGDYVGRTLDVFISKLRKKLEADASLKIVNIRGVGYRFVMG